MTSEIRQDIDLLVKVLGAVGLIASIVWSVVQYMDTVDRQITERKQEFEKEIAEMQREARKPFLERQLALYIEAAQMASRIATSTDVQERDAAIARFRELYWGDLAVVEDAKVAASMVAFRNELERALERRPHEPLVGTGLERAAIAIAHACRDSIQKSWDVELGDIGAELRGDGID